MMWFDPLYLMLLLPAMLFAGWAQWSVKRTFARYSQEPTQRGLSGAEVAAAILDVHGVRGVRIEPSRGFLSDHYDPTDRALRLSQGVFEGRTIAAAGVAAHEVGHALQHAAGYRWLTLRSRLVPVLSITSSMAMPALFVGFGLMAFGAAGLGQFAMLVGAALFSVAVVFQLVTLPVEFDASKRALVAIRQGQILTPSEHDGARKVLNAAALTYVAAAMASLLQLVYFLIRAGVLGGRDD
jgi:uncharacterized protein